MEGFVVKFEGGFGGGDHFVLSDASIGKEEIVLVGELADEFALSATVALTKRMESIDFGEIIGETLGELEDR